MTYKSHQLFSWDASHAKIVLYVFKAVARGGGSEEPPQT